MAKNTTKIKFDSKGNISDEGYYVVDIPDNVENLQLPDPSLLQFYKNYDNRILWIDDEVDNITLEYAKMIMQWNFEDAQNNLLPSDRVPIKILFFCPGGDLDVNNCLVDTISLSATPVIGVNVGEAASSGCFIYLACHKRYTFPTAQFLIHQGAGEFAGTYENVLAAIMNYQKQIEDLGQYVLSRTNIPEDVFYEHFSTDWYIDANEAVKLGVAKDGIITSLDNIIVE